MATALTGVQRSQPALATRPVAESVPASPAAAFRATALARGPPNQADSPGSCRRRDRVLGAMAGLRSGGGLCARSPSGVPPCSLCATDLSGGDRPLGAVAQRRPFARLGRLDL